MRVRNKVNITQKVLRILFPPIYPTTFSIYCKPWPCLQPSRSHIYPGFFAELMQLISVALNYRIEPVFMNYNDGLVGEKQTPWRRWVTPMTASMFGDMVEYVKNGSVDFVAYPVHKTAYHESNYEFSIPIYTTTYKVFYRGMSPSKNDSIWSFLMIYNNDCKYVLGSIFLLQTIFYVCNELLLNKSTIENERIQGKFWIIAKCFFITARVQLGKPVCGYTRTKSAVFSTMFTSFLSVVIVLGAYSQLMTAKLVVIKTEAGIHSIDDMLSLIRSNTYHLFNISSNEFLHERLQTESSYPFLQLRQVLEFNPMQSMSNYTQSQEEIVHNRGMLISSLLSADMFNIGGRCAINTINEDLFTTTSHFLYKTGNPLKPEIDNVLIMYQVAIQNIYRKYENLIMSLHNDCSVEEKRVRTSRPFFGVCLALIFPAIISFIVFCIELLWWHCDVRRRSMH